MLERLHSTLICIAAPTYLDSPPHREIFYGKKCAVVATHLMEGPVPVCPKCAAPMLVEEETVSLAECLYLVLHIMNDLLRLHYNIVTHEEKFNFQGNYFYLYSTDGIRTSLTTVHTNGAGA